MRVLLGVLWAIVVFTTLWVLAANALFPWIDKKREARDPEHWVTHVSMGDLLDGKERDDDDRAER